MNLTAILIGVIAAVAVPLVLYLFGLLLPRKRTYGLGYKLGRLLTTLGQRRIGRKWESIEDRFKATVADFVQGVYEGLDSDDAKIATN